MQTVNKDCLPMSHCPLISNLTICSLFVIRIIPVASKYSMDDRWMITSVLAIRAAQGRGDASKFQLAAFPTFGSSVTQSLEGMVGSS